MKHLLLKKLCSKKKVDQRPLSRLEAAFRSLVKDHLATLLDSKCVYWKQRNTIRWVKFGDENNHFFHSIATISHKRNFIVSLSLPDGTSVIDHDKKANILWTAFKNRLGVSNFSNMAYDLSNLLTLKNLENIDDDFSDAEIDSVIKDLPNSHALGPDGFNGLFIKKCWITVKDDFLKLFKDFHLHNIDLRSINSSYIALIPKKDSPKKC